MRLRHNYLLISLNCLTVLLIVNLNCVSSSSLPVNKLVNEALKRQQREALAEAASESTTELSEDSESDLGPSGSVNKVTTIKPTNLSSTNSTNHNKIDWDEIESTWYEFKDDEEVTKKWNDMENGLKKGVKAVLRSIFPRIVSMSSDTKVSGNCSAGILKWLISLRSLKDWSIKMLDAIGKPSAGLLEGQVSMFGNYHECLGVRVMEEDDEDVFDDEEEDKEEGSEDSNQSKEFFRGKYCILEFKPWLPKKPPFYGMKTKLKALERPKKDDTVMKDVADLAVFLNFVSMRMDLCVPSLCSRNDIQKVVGLIGRLIDVRGKVVRCEVDEDPLTQITNPQVAALIILVLLFFLFATLTVVGLCTGLFKNHGSIVNYLRSLTWTTAWSELMSESSFESKSRTSVLYGLRTIIMFWIIMVHTAIEVNFQFFRDVLWIRDVALSWPAQFLTKSSYNFDMFIAISAFTMAYTIGSSNALKSVKFIARKYLRITPIVMIAVGWLTILPLGKKIYRGGPTWGDFVPKASANCANNGLFNLLYIQNFLDPASMCLKNTWIFAVEMQLYLIFIPLLLLVRKTSRASLMVLLTIISAIGFLCNLLTVYNYELPPHLIWTLPDPQQRDYYYKVHYFKPWTHLSVFAIGIGAGHLCSSRNKKTSSSSSNTNSPTSSSSHSSSLPYGIGVSSFLFWCASLVTIFCLIFMYHTWVLGDLPAPLISGIYDGAHRILIALAFSYIIYSLVCLAEDAPDSCLVQLLGSRFLITTGRLTLIAYTIHPIIQFIFLGTQSSQLFSGPIVALYVVMGNIMMTYVHSFIISILFEIPIATGLRARTMSSKGPSNSFDFTSKTEKQQSTVSGIINNNKSSTITMVSSINGDIELSKSNFERH
ncbi:nose resistant to fluoxetine protein 6-like [Panonychus citri]|uniref:nose resistant to fluoxetine protein 6-like n=1 Tax=Panonychus citri TaxID=50023 RepID=UPI002307FE56|nr:nose resistant to fluoxetine protein 6-like [Panonychus citri]XP_053208216.1 nose resistant to fluoxetine protein 6-like [Panonychus citri]